MTESPFLMRVSRFQAPSAGFTVFCAAVTLAALALSYWQHGRATLKDDLQRLAGERMGTAPLDLADAGAQALDELVWRPARAIGTYEAEGGFLIDNRVHRKQPGFHVITPLALDDRWLLVNRGWIEAARPRVAAPLPEPPEGLVTVTGLLTADSGDAFELAEDTGEGGIWQNLRIERWKSRTGREALPVVLLADSAPQGMVPVASAPDYLADRSRGYRLQWLGLALVAMSGWLAVGLRRTR